MPVSIESQANEVTAMAKFRLWTPVANALEAYRRRFIANPTALYEHVWRLIHIEESLVVTLGSLLTSRLIDLFHDSPSHREMTHQLRTLVTGIRLTDDGNIDLDNECTGCLSHGSIGAWTDLLDQFSTVDADCPFLKAMFAYLKDDTSLDTVSFIEPWQRISPVPELFRSAKSRIGHLKAMNAFRNKLAHVPISERIITPVFHGLRKEVLMLLTDKEDMIKSDSSRDVTCRDWHPPLRGRIENAHGWVDGSDFGKAESVHEQGVWFVWLADDATKVQWDAAPFVRCDGELKVSLLFRVPGLEEGCDGAALSGEYHRFAAESEPVQECDIDEKALRRLIPDRPDEPNSAALVSPPPDAPTPDGVNGKPPTEEDIGGTEPTEAGSETPSPASSDNEPDACESVGRDAATLAQLSSASLRDRGESAYHIQDYSSAVLFFDHLQQHDDPTYYNHVAKLKHGESLWKAAERSELSNDEKRQIINRSIELLRDATHHRDVRYEARSRYQLSKALWHLSRYEPGDTRLISDAVDEAKQAAESGYKLTYMSWYDRLRELSEGPGLVRNV